MAEGPNLGSKVRALRRRHELTQVKMAERLGISPSYLNLIEHGRRPLTAPLLIKLAQQFEIDLQRFSADDEAQLTADLMEVFGDPLFERHQLTNADVRELVRQLPTVGKAVRSLYDGYQSARESMQSLATTMVDDLGEVPGARLPSEEVTDLVQQRNNYFPQLEEAAAALWRDAKLDPDDVYEGMVRYLERELGVKVRVVTSRAETRAVRRFDADRRVLSVSEVLAPRSRHFQLAHQIGLLVLEPMLEPIVRDPVLTTEDSRRLARMVLANYYAGAVLMPYDRFYEAARGERYDVELLGHRFRTSFEQVCHRLTTLRRPGKEGVPFHFQKMDLAGNISKRFSASGIHFSRFGGACPRWNVSRAFLSPGKIRVQISRMPDGATYFCIAQTVSRRHGGYRATETVHAVGLGCRLEHADQLVYSDGIDLVNVEQAVVPIGVTCRLCERNDCDQRAFPSLQRPLELDANVRGVGFYTAIDDEEGL